MGDGLPPTLNGEQFRLWSSTPGLAGKVADAVAARIGSAVPRDDLLPLASRGAVEAAAAYDRHRGVPYENWAFFYAAWWVYDRLPGFYRGQTAVLQRIREAMLEFTAHHEDFFDWREARDRDRRALASFTDGMLFAGALAAGSPTAITRGEEDLVHVQGAQRAGEALRALLAELPSEQILLLQELGAFRTPKRQVAKALHRSDRWVREEYNALLARCGARLGTLLGMSAMPVWEPDVSGQVFPDPPQPANDAGADE